MKKSLQKAISLFNRSEQLSIIWAILCLKLQKKIPAKAAALFASCNKYVLLIEQGVSFNRAGDNLVRASLLINQKQVSVFLRNSSSDLQVFHSVIVNEEYKIAKEKLLTGKNGQEKVIIDAGGNIGLTTIYLHSFYPDAKFFIIEPDEKNTSILKLNLKENNITPAMLFKNALWTSDEKLRINNSFRDGKEWSLTVERASSEKAYQDDGFTKGISLQDICSISKIQHIDLLKIDIEGGERFLFSDNDFLNIIKTAVQYLIIEIHDEFNIRNDIYTKMDAGGFLRTDASGVTFFEAKKSALEDCM